ncbi:hypothetical protein LX32DRAFT_709495 [Colletotrichum zoysiae]|uniref:Uncharacterized protein n=1 Tax=Colletotrichum zoysiae TaxID=1216348 RepID=A0AAD9M380_9PEZI|nr:hypothetical protein LX32DRAFT_709495 [Colletotrichum zoysiae]
MDRKTSAKDGHQAKKTLARIEADSEKGLYEKQIFRHRWTQCRIKYIECDSCEKLAGEQVPHQICGVCAVAICRECVTAGKMKLYPTHPQKSVGELDWRRPSVIAAVSKAGHGPAPLSYIASGNGSGGQLSLAMAIPVRQKPAASAASLSNGSNTCSSQGDSSRKEKGKTTAGLASSNGPKQIQTFPVSNKNPSPALSTPTNKKKKKNITLFARDSDPEYAMGTPSNAFSDKEYIPRVELNRKSSTTSKKGANETGSISSSVNNTPVVVVGLANSRPVRASTIQTYEKMRQANVKKQRDVDEFHFTSGEEQNTKYGLKMGACAQNTRFVDNTTSAENLTDGDQNDYYAQQGTVYSDNAFLYASEEVHNAAGYDVKSCTQTYHHNRLPQLHPGPGPKAQLKAIEFPVPAVISDDKRHAAVAVVAEDTPTPKRQNNSSESFIPVSKAELSAASTNAIREAEAPIRASIRQITPAERDADRALVTAGLNDLAAAIENKVCLRLFITVFRTMQSTEIELRNAIHEVWVSNMAIAHIKHTDGALAAMQILRGYANLLMMRMKVTGSGLLKNWIDATEKDIQDSAAFVPEELRIQNVEPAVQEGFMFDIVETDIYMANILAEMKDSTR